MYEKEAEQLQTIIDDSERIVFFGGAGVSTESDIPDFRSADGLYRQKYKYSPEQIVSHSFFVQNPEGFYEFYKEKMMFLDAKPNAAHRKLAELEAAQKLAAELKGKEVTIEAKAGDGGRLFGAITNKDVAEAINSKFNLSIDKKKVVIGTIKVAGGYDVEVKLYPEVSTKMKVVIVPKQ